MSNFTLRSYHGQDNDTNEHDPLLSALIMRHRPLCSGHYRGVVARYHHTLGSHAVSGLDWSGSTAIMQHVHKTPLLFVSTTVLPIEQMRLAARC